MRILLFMTALLWTSPVFAATSGDELMSADVEESRVWKLVKGANQDLIKLCREASSAECRSAQDEYVEIFKIYRMTVEAEIRKLLALIEDPHKTDEDSAVLHLVAQGFTLGHNPNYFTRDWHAQLETISGLPLSLRITSNLELEYSRTDGLISSTLKFLESLYSEDFPAWYKHNEASSKRG